MACYLFNKLKYNVIFVFILIMSCELGDGGNYPELQWNISGQVIDSADSVPITGAVVELNYHLQGRRHVRLQEVDQRGRFSFAIPTLEQPVEVLLSSKKNGYGESKIQSYWLDGRSSITIRQTKSTATNNQAPWIAVDAVEPFQLLDQNAAVSIAAKSDSNLHQFELLDFPDRRVITASDDKKTLNYLLQPQKLKFQGINFLILLAVDVNGNRSEVYLPYLKSATGELIDPPGSGYNSLISANATTTVLASDSDDLTSRVKVSFAIENIVPGVKGIRVYRSDGYSFAEIAYSTRMVRSLFVYEDNDFLLTPQRQYKYKFAYDGDKYSLPSKEVIVDVLPSYTINLLDPVDQAVVTRGSNIVFRWQYVGEKPPENSTWQEQFEIYKDGVWEEVLRVNIPVKSWETGSNSISEPLNYFSQARKYSWTVSSSITRQYDGFSSAGYWEVKSESRPSVFFDYSSSGFFSFTREAW